MVPRGEPALIARVQAVVLSIERDDRENATYGLIVVGECGDKSRRFL